MTLDGLRKSGLLQDHHWQAARWFSERFSDRQICVEISTRWKDHRAVLDVFTGATSVDPIALLNRAVVERQSFRDDDDAALGLLREALNVVNRIRMKSCKTTR